jgi:hypothetical protein
VKLFFIGLGICMGLFVIPALAFAVLNSDECDERIAPMTTAAKNKLILHCSECGTEIEESAAFAFGGAFACEKCVRNYYRNRPGEVERELRERRQQAIRALSTDRKNLEKMAASKRTALPPITVDIAKLPLLCIECKTEIDVAKAFEFGGGVACEKCVREYYRNRPDELAFELESRHRRAIAWVKRNRKTLEKQAARKRVAR